MRFLMNDIPLKDPGIETFDALPPPGMALACEAAGVTKATRNAADPEETPKA